MAYKWPLSDPVGSRFETNDPKWVKKSYTGKPFLELQFERMLINSGSKFHPEPSDVSVINDDDQNWQNWKKSPVDRFSYILRTGFRTDFKLNAAGREFKVHKLILAMHSKVFERMFYGSIPCTQNYLQITETSPEAVEWILNYMYKGVLSIGDANLAAEVYAFAHMRQMDLVVARCSKFLEMNVNEDNVAIVSDLASMYSDDQLRDACRKILLRRRSSLLSSKRVVELSQDVLIDAVSQEFINTPEKTLFKSILLWAHNQLENQGHDPTPKDLREAVLPFLPSIRFLTMTLDEFITEIIPSNILTTDESLTILRRIQGHEVEIPSFISAITVKRKVNRAEMSDHSTRIFPEPPGCVTNFIYNHMLDTYTDKIVIFRCNETVHLTAVKLRPKCYIGKWTMILEDSNQNELARTSKTGPAWTFTEPVHMDVNVDYIVKVVGTGRRTKHPVNEFRATNGSIIFNGISIGCIIHLEYFC